MTTIRDDAKEKLTHALTLVALARRTKIQAMVEQHLSGAERIIESVLSSIKGSASA